MPHDINVIRAHAVESPYPEVAEHHSYIWKEHHTVKRKPAGSGSYPTHTQGAVERMATSLEDTYEQPSSNSGPNDSYGSSIGKLKRNEIYNT